MLGHGLLDGAADQLRRARMGRMRLDDHRAAGRQGGGGVAAGHREREREVAGAEHRDRADRRQRAAAGPGGAAGCGRAAECRADASPAAVPDDRREQPQLTDRPGRLPGDSAGGQPGLRADPVGQRRAECLDVGGDALQEGGPLLAGGPPIDREGLGRQGRRLVHLGGSGFAVRGVELGPGGGSRARNVAPRGVHVGGPDQGAPVAWTMITRLSRPGRRARRPRPRSGRSAADGPGRRSGRSPSCRP